MKSKRFSGRVLRVAATTAAIAALGAFGAAPGQAAPRQVAPRQVAPRQVAQPAASHRTSGASTIAIGDSVMLGAKPCLEAAGIAVDAQGSRSPRAGVAAIRALGPDLPPHLIVHLGTNGGIERQDVEEVMTLAGPGRTITWVTIQLPDGLPRYTFEARSNEVIRAVVASHPNARLADWQAVSDRVAGLVWSEGIHLTPKGCQAFAEVVERANVRRPHREDALTRS